VGERGRVDRRGRFHRAANIAATINCIRVDSLRGVHGGARIALRDWRALRAACRDADCSCDPERAPRIPADWSDHPKHRRLRRVLRPSLVAFGVALAFAACSAGSSSPMSGDGSAPAIDASSTVDAPIPAMDASDASDATDASAIDATPTLDAAPAIDPGKDADSPCDPSVYPCGPYGFSVGSVAPDLTFEGRVDTNGDGAITAADGVSRISFASLRAGPSTQALAVIGSAGWCTACNAEAPNIVSLAASYKSTGDHVAFLSDLIDSNMPGIPATFRFLDLWAAKYKIGYPISIDPTHLLAPFFSTPAFPTQMVIRTRDMVIMWVNAGADPMALQAQIDAVLANP
jgi:hypothetical protein